MSAFMIKALTAETFDDFAGRVERSKGMFASCWCTKFHRACAEKGQSAEGNRALKRRLVAGGIAHAPLVNVGDRAVALDLGWFIVHRSACVAKDARS